MKYLFLLLLCFGCAKITNPNIETSTDYKKIYVGNLIHPITSVQIDTLYDSLIVQIQDDSTWVIPTYYVNRDTVKILSENQEGCYSIVLYLHK